MHHSLKLGTFHIAQREQTRTLIFLNTKQWKKFIYKNYSQHLHSAYYALGTILSIVFTPNYLRLISQQPSKVSSITISIFKKRKLRHQKFKSQDSKPSSLGSKIPALKPPIVFCCLTNHTSKCELLLCYAL